MQIPFQFAGGTVIGMDHRRLGRNNQDAFTLITQENLSIAVICDGCSDGQHHEAGAIIGARIVGQALLRRFSTLTDEHPIQTPDVWEDVRQDVLAELRVLGLAMSDNLREVVANYFLFTVLGGVFTPKGAAFFAIGDGVFIINGQKTVLGPFENNEPPYLGYSLTRSSFRSRPELLKFRIVDAPNAENLEWFLIGTDGVHDLLRAANLLIPGSKEPVGTIGQFLKDGMFVNPQSITRRLRMCNRDVCQVEADQFLGRDPGRLHDDTTFIVGKTTRKENAQ